MIKNNMYAEAKRALENAVANAYRAAVAKGELVDTQLIFPEAEVPRDSTNGDLSSTFALSAAKALRMPPRKIAEIIVSNMEKNELFSSCSVAGPGFINVFFGPEWYRFVLETAETMAENYGYDNIGRGQKVMLEFVSANPTGPMHLGNARGGVLGDSLAAVLERAGYDVWREFYVNDAGNQVDLFGKSIEARYMQQLTGEDFPFPENGYHGDDIKELAAEIIAEHGDKFLNMPSEQRQKFMCEYGLKKNIERMRADLARYKVEYDKWFYESSLHESGYVKETIDLLNERGMLYEKDGALWFKGTEFGMEKDEVLVKSNGFYTYYAVDIAYHRNKFCARNFDRVIDVLGADHHGHVVRFKAGMQALGIDPSRLDFVLMQLVSLFRNGEAVRMSKRTGKMITLSNLLDDINVDAARFFFNLRQSDTHLEFDLDLAVKQESDNPVYYVQYAHARICTMLKKLAELGLTPSKAAQTDINLLSGPSEKALIKRIAYLPEEIRLAARDLEPYHLTKYLIELATDFHSFYTEVRIKDAEEKTARARLMLADITRSVLANALGMLKISAPEHM
jgi:arginyl-tRNA synthetase